MRCELLLVVALLAAPAAPTLAGEPAKEMPTLMLKRGKLLLSDDLNKPLGPDWAKGKGKWDIVEGALRGMELADDMHAGTRRRPLEFDSAVFQVELKLAGAKQTTLSINGAGGHVCRVILNASGFSVKKDNDKKTGDKGAVLDTVKVEMGSGWHTLTLELAGKDMLAQLDGKHTAFGTHEKLNVKKTNIGFTVSGASVSYRNLRVWDGTVLPTWDATRAKLASERKSK